MSTNLMIIVSFGFLPALLVLLQSTYVCRYVCFITISGLLFFLIYAIFIWHAMKKV